jgi:hypothetical protein
MKYLLCLFSVLIGSYVFAQDCKPPVGEVGLKRLFEYLPRDYTIITYKSLYPKIQWVGLYWEGPISGALMAYDCEGEFLSGVKTGGVQSLKLFNGPRRIGPTVVTEELYTGTGLRHVGHSVYTIEDKKIRKIWEHTIYESVVLMPSQEERVDRFEITAVGSPPDDLGDKLKIEGVRELYPAGKDSSLGFQVEKLPPKYYCWTANVSSYRECK